MPVFYLIGKTHVALFAVEEPFCAAHPAYSAPETVVLVLVLVVEQVALETSVLQKG